MTTCALDGVPRGTTSTGWASVGRVLTVLPMTPVTYWACALGLDGFNVYDSGWSDVPLVVVVVVMTGCAVGCCAAVVCADCGCR